MRVKGVWRGIKLKDMKPGHRLLGTKWVFKKKLNGTYRARLVAQGYNQIPGVDFTDSFSPVISDPILRIILILADHCNWSTEQIDVEGAFLNGEIDCTIYMRLPDGYKEEYPNSEDEALVLDKSIYGLVQSSCTWVNSCMARLEEPDLKFKRNLSDGCVLYKEKKWKDCNFCHLCG